MHYTGIDVIWFITSTVHVETETKTKCPKDPAYAIFLESSGFKDIKYISHCEHPTSTGEDILEFLFPARRPTGCLF